MGGEIFLCFDDKGAISRCWKSTAPLEAFTWIGDSNEGHRRALAISSESKFVLSTSSFKTQLKSLLSDHIINRLIILRSTTRMGSGPTLKTIPLKEGSAQQLQYSTV